MIQYEWFSGAAPKDALDIRIEVFCVEQGYSLPEELDDLDERSWHLVAYEDGTAIGTGRMYAGSGEIHIGRLAVRKNKRGSGLGAGLMAEMEKKAVALGYSAALLSAQCRAAGFYEKRGYAREGAPYMDGHVEHIQMRKDLT